MTTLLWTWFALQTASAPTSAPTSASRPAAEFDAPEVVCTIDDRSLKEASGIVASRANPGLYYTHNDSGGKPIVYAIDREGRIRAELTLESARNVDWEDISLAPGSAMGTFDICVADIGDNDAKRPEVHIYRFPESKIDGPKSAAHPVRTAVAPVRYTLKFADGPRNAEALAIHPRTGDGFIISKRRDGVAEVYRIPAPWQKDGTIEIERIGKLMFSEAAPIQTIVTAADFSPDGTQLVTRSYPCGWLWTMPANGTNGDVATLIRQAPVRLELAAEPQGEAICFSADGRCLLTISEKSPTRLYECCRPK